MGFIHCVWRSLISSSATQTSTPPVSSSSNETTPVQNLLLSVLKKSGQLSPLLHFQGDTAPIVQNQLTVSLHACTPNLRTSTLSHAQRHLVTHIELEFPRDLSFFAELVSPSFHLYRIVSMDNLHVMNLSIIRQYSDMTNTFLQRCCALPLTRSIATRSIAIENYRYSLLAPAACL